MIFFSEAKHSRTFFSPVFVACSHEKGQKRPKDRLSIVAQIGKDWKIGTEKAEILIKGGENTK